MSFAAAMLRHKAKWTKSQPCMSSTLWDCVLLPLALRLNHWFNEKSRPFNWEASEASSWPIISVIVHLWHANLRTNTRRNYQIHSCHHYQKGCIFDGWEKVIFFFWHSKFPSCFDSGTYGFAQGIMLLEHNKHMKEHVIATTRKPGQAYPLWAEKHHCWSEMLTFCSSLDKQNIPTTDRAGSVLLSPVLTFIFQDITPDNKGNGNTVAIAYPYDQIWAVTLQKPYCFPHKQPEKQQMGLCLSSQQSKPPEDSVHQRQCNTVTLTKALMISGLFFAVFSSPLLFQAWEPTSLFTAELLVDEVAEDCREGNEDSSCRQKLNGLRCN